jgi:hypothetical protein
MWRSWRIAQEMGDPSDRTPGRNSGTRIQQNNNYMKSALLTTIAFPIISNDAVRSQLKSLISAALTDPARWKSELEAIRSRLTFEAVNRYAEARSAAKRASGLPQEERGKSREEILMKLETDQTKEALETAAMNVMRAAVTLGESREKSLRLAAEFSETETSIAKITETMIKLQAPNAQHDKTIEKLKKERDKLETWDRHHASFTNQEWSDALRDLSIRGEFKGEPSQRGFQARLNEIENEIQSVKDRDDDERLSGTDVLLFVDELKAERGQLEGRLAELKPEALTASAIEKDAVKSLDAARANFEEHAPSIIAGYETTREIRMLVI